MYGLSVFTRELLFEAEKNSKKALSRGISLNSTRKVLKREIHQISQLFSGK